MQKQINELNFEGENIYVGLEVHLKSWAVTIYTKHLHHKVFTQSEYVEVLVKYLHRNFPAGNYYSVYEAGFSGFCTHYKLKGSCHKSVEKFIFAKKHYETQYNYI